MCGCLRSHLLASLDMLLESRVEADQDVHLVELAYMVLQRHPGPICICSTAMVCKALDIGVVGGSGRTQPVKRLENCRLDILTGPWIGFGIRLDQAPFQICCHGTTTCRLCQFVDNAKSMFPVPSINAQHTCSTMFNGYNTVTMRIALTILV